MRISLAAAFGAAAVLGGVLMPAAASAATHGSAPATTPTPAGKQSADPDTTVTFTVTSGALTMTAPGTAKFSSGGPGSTIKGSLGTVSVTDGRALDLGQLDRHRVLDQLHHRRRIPGGDDPGRRPLLRSRLHHDHRRDHGHAAGVALSASPQTIVAGTNGAGINTASWTPVIVVSVPTTAVAGTYTGTITESVS